MPRMYTSHVFVGLCCRFFLLFFCCFFSNILCPARRLQRKWEFCGEAAAAAASLEGGFQRDQAEGPFLFDCPLPPV